MNRYKDDEVGIKVNGSLPGVMPFIPGYELTNLGRDPKGVTNPGGVLGPGNLAGDGNLCNVEGVTWLLVFEAITEALSLEGVP